jgi:hypothetical protein
MERVTRLNSPVAPSGYLTYSKSVGETNSDLFVNTEPEVEVDAETAAAIELGIKAADEGRVVTLIEARKRMRQWLSVSSSQNPR